MDEKKSVVGLSRDFLKQRRHNPPMVLRLPEFWVFMGWAAVGPFVARWSFQSQDWSTGQLIVWVVVWSMAGSTILLAGRIRRMLRQGQQPPG
jgi:hypothetical protein